MAVVKAMAILVSIECVGVDGDGGSVEYLIDGYGRYA